MLIYPWTAGQDEVFTWGTPVAIRAAVYPLGENMDTAAYGESVKDMRRMLYDGKEALCVGMGVSLDGGTPVYRIVSMEKWSHTSAVIERIPEGRRG